MTTLHIVGAGLAGLAAAVEASGSGLAVRLYEAAPRAGGRCRSFFEPTLERAIDNGNHLILGGMRETFRYVAAIDATERLVAVAPAAVPFLDLQSGELWRVGAGLGPLVRALAGRGVLVPGGRWRDLARLLRLAAAPEHLTVAEALGPDGALYERLWAPLAVAALNTAPQEGAARLLWPVVARTLLRGAAASRPYVARDGLGPALVDPALTWLAQRGATIVYGRRATALAFGSELVEAIRFGEEQLVLPPGDGVVLAVPGPAANALVPGLAAPSETRAIVNTHFRLDGPARLPGGAPILGLIGAAAEWLFARGDVVSVTVSAADALAELPAEEIAARMWRDVAAALGVASAPLPPVRVIKEKRATPAQTPAFAASRPAAATPWPNLWLAGDWTRTGLPATIESAIASGRTAATLAAAAAKGGL